MINLCYNPAQVSNAIETLKDGFCEVYFSLFQSSLPLPLHAQVWIDFDGTISREDVLDELVSRFACNDSWKIIEERWRAGLIGSEECLRSEFSLVRVKAAELAAFLDQIHLDPGFEPLLQILEQYNVPVTILSDGIETFIRRILTRHGLGHLTIRANRARQHRDRLHFSCPHRNAQCASAAAHCKCNSANLLAQAHRRSIYIGDGRSDLCPARQADVVFAKGALAKALSTEHVPYIPYSGLTDVTMALSNAWMTKAAVV